jgi:hypothetical protein
MRVIDGDDGCCYWFVFSIVLMNLIAVVIILIIFFNSIVLPRGKTVYVTGWTRPPFVTAR